MTREEWADVVHEQLAGFCESTVSFSSGRIDVLCRRDGREYAQSVLESDVINEGQAHTAASALVDQMRQNFGGA